MDANAIINSIFTALQTNPLVVLVMVSAWVSWKLWIKVAQLQDLRIDDAKTFIRAQNDISNSMEKLANAVASNVDEIRRHRGE